MGNKLSLTVDTTNKKYIRIQLLDAANAAVGYGDTIYCGQIRNISCTDGKAIGINKKGGYQSGVQVEYDYLIPYNDLVLYNGGGVPPIDTILAAIHTIVIYQQVH